MRLGHGAVAIVAPKIGYPLKHSNDPTPELIHQITIITRLFLRRKPGDLVGRVRWVVRGRLDAGAASVAASTHPSMTSSFRNWKKMPSTQSRNSSSSASGRSAGRARQNSQNENACRSINARSEKPRSGISSEAGGASGGASPSEIALGSRPIAYRQQRRLGEPASKTCIGLGRLRIRIDDEENERLDGAAASLFEKPDLFHDGEEILEHTVAEIDDVCAVVGGNQPLEKCHLAEDVTDVGNRRELRQIIRQLRSFVGQVVCRHRTIIEDIELGEQPRNQSFSDAPTRRANDVERSGLVGHTTLRFGTIQFPPVPRCARSSWARHSSRPPVSSPGGRSTGRTAARAMVERRSEPRPPRPPTGLLRRVRNLYDRSRPADRDPEDFLCIHDVGEADAVVLGPDIAEPMTDIAPEHE